MDLVREFLSRSFVMAGGAIDHERIGPPQSPLNMVQESRTFLQ